jgi:hypothetical protein
MPRKLFSTTFGGTLYDTGVMQAGAGVATSETLQFLSGANTFGVDKHDDEFYLDAAGNPDLQAGAYMTWDFHDMRDLLEEGECLSNVMVGIQRLKETPIPYYCYNVTPLQNIYETILITNSEVDTQPGELAGGALASLYKAGFQPIYTTGRNVGMLDDMREVIYCERRVYGQDRSQEFSSPNEMGGMATPGSGGGIPTRWLNNWLLMDRTVTGEADLVIGPNITIMRIIQEIGRFNPSVQQHQRPQLRNLLN